MEGVRKGSSCRKDVVEITTEGRERQDECSIQIDMNNMNSKLRRIEPHLVRASSP